MLKIMEFHEKTEDIANLNLSPFRLCLCEFKITFLPSCRIFTFYSYLFFTKHLSSFNCSVINQLSFLPNLCQFIPVTQK